MNRVATVLAAIALLAGCKPPPAPPPVTVFVKVVDEAKEPVPNAEITSASQVITTTAPDGRAQIAVGGRDGATFIVDVRCPQGYRSPGVPLEIRRLENNGAPPEYVTRCNRMRHTLVVNVQTVNAAGNMPVLHLGKEVARTDAKGKARVVIEGDVLERVDLQLDTSDAAYARIHPQNPVGSFEIPNRDDELTFDVKFKEDPKPKPKVFRRAGPIAM